jgi:hypothetical protein
MTVKSWGFNAELDLTPMNDIFELWSLPWHALQRSLAQSYGDESAGEASFRKSLADAQLKLAETDTWRAQARGAAARR